MNVHWKKIMAIGLAVFSFGMMGCASKEQANNDYLICNQTSNGKMAEIETGYFLVWDEFLYYADKGNLENWVVVCNKPDCMHNERYECNASLPGGTKIWQKDGKLYQMFQGREPRDGIQIYELTMDGSGFKKVYDIPMEEEYKTSSSRGGSNATFQDEFFLSYGYLNEKGIHETRLLRLRDDENGEMEVSTLYSGEESVTVMSGNECWSIRGDNVLINTLVLEEGDMLLDSLCIVNEKDEFVPFDLPKDVPLIRGYLDGNLFTYYNANEGFYQYDIETGEKECIFENHFQDGTGCILSEDYMVEYCYATASESAKLKVYNGSEWLDVELPEEVLKAKQSKTPFFPTSIASDRMIFQLNILKEENNVAVGTNLYYMMLEEETPKLVFAGRIGEKFISEEETTVGAEDDTEFEEMTIFDNDDGVLKVTGVRKDVDSRNRRIYCVDLFFEIGDSERNYNVKIEALVNGIQCDTNMSLDTLDSETGNIEVKFYESTLKKYGVMDVYSFDEVTDIELFFYVNEAGLDNEEILKKSVHVYPNGEEAAVHYTREPQETDMVFVDNEKVKVTVVGYETTKVENDTPIFFVENKTDQEIYFKVAAASINGAQDYSISSDEGIQGGGCAFVKVILGDEYFSKDGMKNFWEQYDVTEIGTIQTFINIGYLDMGKNKEIGEPFVKELITLYPQGEEHARDDARPQQEMDVVLVDNDYIRITHIGYEENQGFDEVIPDVYTKILVENKTDDILYSQIVASGNNGNIYNAEDSDIPHILLPGTYYIQKTGNPIGDVIRKREFLYQVFDKNKNLVNQEYIALYPLGEDAVEDYPTDLENMEEILVDNESFTIAVSRYSDYTDVSKKERITYADSWIELYFINKTDKILYFKMCDISINGIAYRTYGSNSTNVEEEAIVFGHGTHFSADIGSFQTLKDTNMTDVEDVEITFKVYEYQCEDTLLGEELGNVTVKFGPEK